MQVLTNPHERLVESESGLNADDGEIESIGQSEANAILAVPDHPLEDEAGKQKTQRRDADQKRHIVEPGQQGDSAKADQTHEHAGTKVVIHVDGVTKSCLNQ